MTEIEFAGFTDRQLDEFRRWQRTSYAVLLGGRGPAHRRDRPSGTPPDSP